jgi:hypothetical protein|tara:strand:+ start:428 stop:1276 length:849 start_codon:yes stop_codon:yes gene_type:complete
MANKKATAKKVEVAPQEVVETVVQPKVETPKKEAPKKDEWVIKDRLYELTRTKPLVFTLPTAHSRKKSLLYFDEKLGYQRELRYATNQRSCFVEEQKGQIVMGRIVFRDGVLRVPKENVALQKLLSLYHPALKSNIYKEYKPAQQASNEVDWIEFELQALNLAKTLSVEEAEAILRVEMGQAVTELSSSEIKRDALIFAKRNPNLFLQLATDENTQLRSFGAKAVEMGILSLSQDQRTFTYGSNGRKIMTVPFDEHPYFALSAFFRTDEGMEVYKAIEKRLN